MARKFILLLCLVGLSLFAAHAAPNGHAVAVVSVKSDDATQEHVCAADGTCSKNAAVAMATAAPAIFEPTLEWKEIQPNQAIPGGLHVRINLQTGKKEAKILTDDDDNVSPDAAGAHPTTNVYHKEGVLEKDEETPHRDENGRVIGESLYNALAQLPEPPTLDGMTIHEAYGKLTKEQFSAYIAKLWKLRQEELKEAAASIRDEAKYMQELIDTLVTPKTGDVDIHEANVVDALQHLEWEVQDLDKAKDFNTMGGLEATVQHLSAPSPRVRTMAAWVVGSAVKHYDQAQTWAVEAGALPPILKALAAVPTAVDDNRASVFAMQKKMLYALSSLLPAHEKAQRIFLRNDGLAILTQLLEHADVPPSIQHKTLVLARHLLLEHDLIDGPPALDHPLAAIQTYLRSPAFCIPTVAFLHKSETLGVRQQVDAIELMLAQVPPCAPLFQADAALRSTLSQLNQTWFTDMDMENEHKAESMRAIARLVHAITPTAV
ncbi:Aste57867_11810 [Aphanomyces stellatus]|uniref:Aste57867_11810 protein n=1 Tax=Aphanomyces stellatus TaxID=120398 RepID=A0A485KUD7_9STRA|nr:hypothetical protein As57867_011765 [Aphanomyces stellatus]VFT88665.1 Aste57867_11810 [Aphanomyces stellatus]